MNNNYNNNNIRDPTAVLLSKLAALALTVLEQSRTAIVNILLRIYTALW